MKRAGTGPLALLRQFFAANPDEELTYDQALQKFDCDKESLHTSIHLLKARGEIGTEVIRVIRARRDEA
jgi:hypothetical protein